MTKKQVKDITKKIIREAFFHYFFDKPRVIDTRQLPLDIFFPEERKVSSLILGLSTSLGTKFWERLALSLAEMNSFTILDPKELKQPKQMPPALSSKIDEYTSLREEYMDSTPVVLSKNYIPEIKILTSSIKSNSQYKNITKGEGADILLRKGHREYAFDIKTVQINAGSGLKFNKTLLKWYAYRYHQQNSKVQNYSFTEKFVFPYNPYLNYPWWGREEGKAKPLDKNDIYVGDEFWSFLTGLNKGEAWTAIQEGLKELHNESFSVLYRKIFELDGFTFRAVLFADRINCRLTTKKNVANINHFSKLRSILDWECCSCNAKFHASISNIKNKVGGCNKCPKCSRVFFDDISDLY